MVDPTEAHALAPHQQHHFETIEQQHETATLGMWVFLATEVMFFGGLFGAYTVYRYQYPHAFAAASDHLNFRSAPLNTAVLIGSSLTMALAVRAAQLGVGASQVVFLLLTIVLGSTFLGIKVVEYHDKFVHHLVPGRALPLRRTVCPRGADLLQPLLRDDRACTPCT